VSKDFNIKFNSFMADFGKIHSDVKNNLFFKYCTSYYGSNMCSLYDVRGMDRLYIDWRKAIRRIWKLPGRTHNSLLPHISNSVPPDIMLHKHFSNFVSSGLCSENKVANFMFNLCLRSNSRMGRNVRFIANKYNLVFNDLTQIKDWNRQIYHHWLRRDNEEDIRISSMISELVDHRDSFHPWLLEHHECGDIINYLCTLK